MTDALVYIEANVGGTYRAGILLSLTVDTPHHTWCPRLVMSPIDNLGTRNEAKLELLSFRYYTLQNIPDVSTARRTKQLESWIT